MVTGGRRSPPICTQIPGTALVSPRSHLHRPHPLRHLEPTSPLLATGDHRCRTPASSPCSSASASHSSSAPCGAPRNGPPRRSGSSRRSACRGSALQACRSTRLGSCSHGGWRSMRRRRAYSTRPARSPLSAASPPASSR